MNPLISIIVPVYNTEKYVGETIDSVIAQTYTNWELNLIDDGSTDSSKQIIESFVEKDSRIKYYHKENGGQASARNLGIKKSTGEYVAFLDSDDIWLSNKLENQINDIIEYNPEFLYGLGYYYFPERDKNHQLEEYEWVTGAQTGSDFFKLLYYSCAVNTNTVILKKHIFEKVGYFDENETIRGTEDWDLWMRIALQVNKVYGSPRRDVYYRIHEGGIHLQEARMKIGKINIYSKYDNDKIISDLRRKKEYRYCFRELFNSLKKEDRLDELNEYFQLYKTKDKYGFGKICQQLVKPFFSNLGFLKVSNKIIYRIAYRMENLKFKLLGSEKT